jgi:predicted O-linked N-acetylglucosamine transferase (SPINDLY family)
MPQVTIEHDFDVALAHHVKGELSKAESLYRSILERNPGHADSMHFLGVIAQQMGRHEIAVALISDSIKLKSSKVEAHFNLGISLFNLGRYEEAIETYTRAIELKGDWPEAYGNLGNAMKAKGRIDEAITSYRRALQLNPRFADAYNNLGTALRSKGLQTEAISAYQQAISIRPDHAGAFVNLGNVLCDAGRKQEAISAYRQAMQINPGYMEPVRHLAGLLRQCGQGSEAIELYETLTRLDPKNPAAFADLGNALANGKHLTRAIDAYRSSLSLENNSPEVHCNLGTMLRQVGQITEAIQEFRTAINQRREYALAYSNLGGALLQARRIDESIAACSRAISLKPDMAEAYNNLANAEIEKGLTDCAIDHYSIAVRIRPDYAEAFHNLGNVLSETGPIDDLIAAYSRAVALKPEMSDAHSHLLFSLHYHPDQDARSILAQARRWSLQHAANLFSEYHRFPNSPDGNRRLRIGYVSPDFRDHVVGRNLIPLFDRHDKSLFDVVCYSDVVKPDSVTNSLQSRAGRWHNICALADDQVFLLIRKDEIDILIDLASHTAHNRLLLFARKPAPIQATYLAYCSTTGLPSMDYRFSDPYLDPPEQDLTVYSERTIVMNPSYWCYTPPSDTSYPNELPALSNGWITFGCLNKFIKISQPSLELWARILRAVPRSRLLLHARPGRHRERMLESFLLQGVSNERIEFIGEQNYQGYFQTYHRIDFSLDPFPYTGGMTSCDSLWMGVPLVTLAGKQTAVSRAGCSVLTNAGLSEFIARDYDEYANIATAAVMNLSRLSSLRATLRSRMRESSLMNAEQYARSIETAYRYMWMQWCGSVNG